MVYVLSHYIGKMKHSVEFSAAVVLLAALQLQVDCTVDIVVHQPFYVEYGSNLTLTCVGDNGRELEWLQTTYANGYQLEVINPVIGGDFITRYTIEKPSYGVESTLIKIGMVLDDRGVYECRDTTQENSFALEATVLYISTDNVAAEAGTDVYLYCAIHGFSTNLPYIDYHWYYAEETIMTNHKYDIVYKDGISQLTVNQPVPSDGGNYTCSFVLQTTKDPVEFSKKLYLDTSALHTSSATKSSFSRRSTAVLMFTITLTVISCLCDDT